MTNNNNNNNNHFVPVKYILIISAQKTLTAN